MTHSLRQWLRPSWTAAAAAVALLGAGCQAQASNHLDTPTVIANPAADIGDVYAWIAPDGRRLNLVMTIVGHSFSERLQYVFHVDSGTQIGRTTASTSIVCRVFTANDAECRVGDADVARGDPSQPAGLEGRKHRFRVFAGPRDDPFFNNVKGTRAAYQVAAEALRRGARLDGAGCPRFDQATSRAIFEQWGHTDGGPAKNFLAGWTSSALVLSVELPFMTRGGRLLAVWATTSSSERQLDRVGRPLTANALLGLLAADEVGDALKERYNTLTPATSAEFISEMKRTLALYDGFDGQCGNQLFANPRDQTPMRYQALATLLADDRLWINSASSVCTQLFAVELATLAGQSALATDCGGRTPLYDAANVWRSLLVHGTTSGVTDGLNRDEREHSTTVFPFLAAPETQFPGSADNNDYKE